MQEMQDKAVDTAWAGLSLNGSMCSALEAESILLR